MTYLQRGVVIYPLSMVISHGDRALDPIFRYDPEEDQIHAYHYVKGANSTAEEHKETDDFWGRSDDFLLAWKDDVDDCGCKWM